MAQIVFQPGVDLANLPPARRRRMVDLDELRAGLEKMRAEWLEATGGSLSKVTLNLSTLFDELGELIGGEHV